MSTVSEIMRLETARNLIRNKLIDFGLAESQDKIDALAAVINAMANRGAPSAQVKEGESYTIQPGYYKGGTVQGVAGGGHYELQAKSFTPTKTQTVVSPDSGYYGLSGVTVAAIPDAYQDVSSVSATAADVLSTKIIVTADGTVTPGTMPNIGAVSQVLTPSVATYTVPKGYHNGNGTVSIVPETKDATPTKEEQEIVPTTGKVLSKVTVAPIPDEYQDVSGVTTTAPHVLTGDVFVDADGSEVTGTMPNNGKVSKTLDATTNNQTYTVPQGYHDGTGTVAIVLEEKAITPTKSTQNVTPASGKVLSKVTVNPIPSNYIDTTDANAIAAHILAPDTAYVNNVKVIGTMVSNGTITGSIDGLTTTSYTIAAGYTNGGIVSLTDDIENSLAAI